MFWVRLRFLLRFFVAFVLLIGVLSIFMVFKSQIVIPNTLVHELMKDAKYQQPCPCTNPIISTDRIRAVTEDVRRIAEDTGKETLPEINTERYSTRKTDKRRSLVIFGDDRSGTTFLTRLFSEDPQIFSVYEPLWITRDWTRDEKGRNLTADVNNVISAIMSCHFASNPTVLKFLEKTAKKWAPGLFKNPFQSSPICNKTAKGQMSCPNPSTVPKLVEQTCSDYYKHSVTKVAIVRVPDRKLSSIFPKIIHDNPDTEIKVLHVVRDPRGSINSRINLQWIGDYQKENFFFIPRATCEGITQNVKFGKSLEGSLKEHYKLLRYQDIASSPVKTALEIYKFAGFEMPESLIRWIVQATNPSKEALEQESKNAFSSVRNATASVKKWRKESPIERIRIIEKECSELFDLLGLERLT